MTKIKPFDIAVMYVIALLASSISSYSAYGQDVPQADVAKYVVKSRAPLDVVVVTSADGLCVREVVEQTGELYRERVGVRNKRTGKTIRTKEQYVEHRHAPAGITSRRLP